MTDAQLLALLDTMLRVMGHSHPRQLATDSLIWASTEGMADVDRVCREWREVQKDKHFESQEAMDREPDGEPRDYREDLGIEPPVRTCCWSAPQHEAVITRGPGERLPIQDDCPECCVVEPIGAHHCHKHCEHGQPF